MTSRVRASILALAFAAFVAIPAVAAAQGAEIGFKAGINRANLSFEGDGDSPDALTGLVAGVYAAKNIKNTLGWRAEVLFSQQGAQEEAGGDTFKFKVNYVNVPFLFTVTPNSSGDTSFNFFGGPQLGLKLSAKAQVGDESEDIDDIKSTAVAVVLGVGAKMGKISLAVSYAHGLTSIATDGDSVKNKVLSAQVGVQIK